MSAAARPRASTRTAANCGCGTPPSASRRRIATLCVIRCAVSRPIPGQPELLRDRRHDGHGPVGGDRQRPVDSVPPGDVDHRVDVRRSRRPAPSSASASPAASGFRSTATTRRPSCLARRIAAPLVAPRADEENGLHSRARCYSRTGNGTPSGSDSTRPMALSGKRILITGGAGFIGTTLARRLVDDNEIVAFDNLHRDALGGHRPGRPPELHASSTAMCSTRTSLTELARGRDPHRPLPLRSRASTPCSRARCGRCA